MKSLGQDNIRLFFSVILALVFTVYLNVAHSEEARQSIRKVNGSIQIAESQIAANVSTVNGSIRVNDYADVANDVSTLNGDVRVLSGSVIEGDLIIEKPKSRPWLLGFNKSSRKPTVEIGANSRINGMIYLGREVDLIIHDSAVVGSIDRDY